MLDVNITDTSYTIEVPIHDDGIAEGEETFTVRIPLSGNIVIQATGTINASVGTPPPPVDISIDGASADEGDDIRFTVNLSAALLEPRTLNIGYTAGTGDTGASLGDLGSARPTTLTLPIGVTSVNFDVPTVDDNDDEENETFTVTLSLPDPPDDPMNTLNITTSHGHRHHQQQRRSAGATTGMMQSSNLSAVSVVRERRQSPEFTGRAWTEKRWTAT